MVALLLATAAAAIPPHSTYINASTIRDVNGNLLASGNFCVVAVQNGIPVNFQAGGGGQVTVRPSCIAVTNGAIPVNTLYVPDSNFTQPSQVGYAIWVTDHTSGRVIMEYLGLQITGTAFDFDTLNPTASNTPQMPPSPATFSNLSLYIGGTLPPYPAITPPAHSIYLNASNIMDVNGNLLQAGNFCVVGVNAGVPFNYQAGGGGQVTVRPSCIAVTNGGIPANTLFVPDSLYTQPTNVGYTVTVTDRTSGKPVLQYIGIFVSGGGGAGPWCSSTACNFDQFIPAGQNLPVVYLTPIQGPPGPTGPQGPSWSGRYRVEDFPSTCTVSSVPYTTQFDCAFATAYSAAQALSANQTLELGNATYLTNVGAQESSVYIVNILGSGANDTTEGLNGGSILRMNASIANSVVNLANLSGAPLRTSPVYRDFLIDANHNSPACLDFNSTREAVVANVTCENATGSSFWVRFGNNGTGLGQNYDAHIGPIKITSPYAYGSGVAAVTATVASGTIATNGYVVTSGGSGYKNGPSVPAYLTGFGAGEFPCSTMPTGLHATISAGVVIAVSSSTPASGCAGNVYVFVSDLPAAAYGLYNGFTTDSTFTDIIVEGVGQVAAIYDLGNAANVWLHPHPWQYQPVGLESHGGGWFIGLQCDSMVRYCADFQGNANGGPHMVNTLYVEMPPGTALYRLGALQLDGSTRDDYIPGNVPADFHRFVVAGFGVIDKTVTNFQNHFPAGFEATGFESYNAPSADKYDFLSFNDQYGFGNVRVPYLSTSTLIVDGGGYINSPGGSGLSDPNSYVHFQGTNASIYQDGTYHSVAGYDLGIGGAGYKVNGTAAIDGSRNGMFNGLTALALAGSALQGIRVRTDGVFEGTGLPPVGIASTSSAGQVACILTAATSTTEAQLGHCTGTPGS